MWIKRTGLKFQRQEDQIIQNAALSSQGGIQPERQLTRHLQECGWKQRSFGWWLQIRFCPESRGALPLQLAGCWSGTCEYSDSISHQIKSVWNARPLMYTDGMSFTALFMDSRRLLIQDNQQLVAAKLQEKQQYTSYVFKRVLLNMPYQRLLSLPFALFKKLGC